MVVLSISLRHGSMVLLEYNALRYPLWNFTMGVTAESREYPIYNYQPGSIPVALTLYFLPLCSRSRYHCTMRQTLVAPFNALNFYHYNHATSGRLATSSTFKNSRFGVRPPFSSYSSTLAFISRGSYWQFQRLPEDLLTGLH